MPPDLPSPPAGQLHIIRGTVPRTRRRQLPWLVRHLAVALAGAIVAGGVSYLLRKVGM